LEPIKSYKFIEQRVGHSRFIRTTFIVGRAAHYCDNAAVWEKASFPLSGAAIPKVATQRKKVTPLADVPRATPLKLSLQNLAEIERHSA